MPDLMDLAAISDETFNLIKAQTTGIASATGLFGVDLSGLTSLVPVNTPFRNGLPRVGATEGAKFATWRTLLNVNASQPDASTQFDFAGALTIFSEQDVFAPYVPLELVGIITQDSMDLAKNWADALSVGTLQNLNQVMISEDINLLNAQNYALPAIGVVTPTESVTGGTIPPSTVLHFACAPRSGKNYYYGGSGPTSADATLTTSTVAGNTHSVTLTVPAVKGAVAYDWFVGPTAGGRFYYTTTTVNTVVVTFLPTANQAIPALPLLSTTAPVGPGPTADSSFNTSWMNGLLAATLGDYGTAGPVTPGSGTSSGAYYTTLNGAFFTPSGQGIAELDALNLSLWNNVHLSPTRYLCNAEEAVNITVKMLSSNRAFTMLSPSTDGRADITAGGWVTHYINNATGGTPIALEVHPHLPPGTLIAVTDRVPFPGANIDTVLSVRTLRDYYAFEYPPARGGGATGGPRHEVAVRSIETLVHKAPVVCGVIQNIGNG